MIRQEIIQYMEDKILSHGYAFFPNAFPYTDISEDEIEELFSYFAKQKISKLTIGRKIKWTKIPDNIGKIISLTSLNINSTTITELPNTISNLTNLETLSIGRSQIKTIDFSLDNFQKLRHIRLSHSKITNLPDMQKLFNLESIVLNDTNIKYIPDYLCKLSNLNLIDVRNVTIDYFPKCLVDNGIKIKTNDVVNLGVSHIHSDSYKVFIQIKDEIKIIVKQYLSYFNQFTKRTKSNNINFNIDESEDGLILNFKVLDNQELEEIKKSLSEYISFTEKEENEIVPHINENTSDYDKTMLMLELRQQVRHYNSMMENAKDNLKVVSSLVGVPYDELDNISASSIIEGFQRLTESTPISNVYLTQTQHQEQLQHQEQTQELQNYLEPLTAELDNLITLIEEPALKIEGEKLLESIYPLVTKPTENKIEESGLLPKLKNFINKTNCALDLIDSTKDTYNRFAENYNGIAKILKYSSLALL